MGTLKLQSNGPYYTAIRWSVYWPLMGGHLVQQGEAWVGCGPAQSPPRCTKCNIPPTCWRRESWAKPPTKVVRLFADEKSAPLADGRQKTILSRRSNAMMKVHVYTTGRTIASIDNVLHSASRVFFLQHKTQSPFTVTIDSSCICNIG